MALTNTYIGEVELQVGDQGIATHKIGSTLFGTCSTASGTAAKVVTLPEFNVLKTGVTIYVQFENENAVSSPTLKVGSTNALPIYSYGNVKADSGAWKSGAVVSFTYNGSAWVMSGSAGSGGESIIYGTCETGASTAQKSVTVVNGSTFGSLTVGTIAIVKFTSMNSSSAPLLKIGNWEAKSIIYDSSAYVADQNTEWYAGAVKTFIYDGTSWAMTDFNKIPSFTTTPVSSYPTVSNNSLVFTSVSAYTGV